LFNQILQLASGMTTVYPKPNLSLIQPFVIHLKYFCCLSNCNADCTGWRWYATYSIWLFDNDIDRGLRVSKRLKMFWFTDLL